MSHFDHIFKDTANRTGMSRITRIFVPPSRRTLVRRSRRLLFPTESPSPHVFSLPANSVGLPTWSES